MKTKKLLTWVAAATMLVGLASCNEPAPAPEPEPEPVVTLSSIEVTELPNKVNYFVGEEFDSDGLEVTAKYSDKSSKVIGESQYTMDLEDGYLFTEADAGYKRVTVTYQEMTDCFTIKIEKAQLAGIVLETNEVKYLYEKGEEFDPNGLTVYAVYNNGDRVELDGEDYVVHAPDMNVYGEQEVYVDYKGFRDSFPIRVREAYWYEEFETMFTSLGIDFDLPGEFLMELSEEVFGYATINLVTYSGLDYYELHFDELNTGLSAWLALYLGVNYAMEPTNFALVEFNYDSYNMEDDTGYMYWEVYSEIGSEGYYVDFYCDGNNNFSTYDDEFRFLIGIREAFTAEETAEALNAALYGSDSVANIEDVSEYGLEPVDAEALEEVSPYFILEAETTYSNAAVEEEEALVEYLLQLPNAEDYSDYASYYDCDAIVVAEFDTDVYSVESLSKVFAVVFEADLGLEFVLGPAQDEDGDYYGVALTPDQAIAIEFACFESDGELLTNFFVYMTDAAYTTFTSLDVMLPGADAKDELLEVLNPDLFEKYEQWVSQFGYFAVSVLDNEGIAAFAQIMGYPKEEYGEQQNYTNINVFPYYQIYETQEILEEGVGSFLTLFGFKTELPNFSEDMPVTTFNGSLEDRACQLMIFDEHDPMYDPYYDPDGKYDDDSLEDLVLAYFENSADWTIDASQYETKGYILTSKETFEVLPGEGPSVIQIQFFTYQYQFQMAIRLVKYTQVLPVAEIGASVDAYYPDVENASAALKLTTLADGLGGEKMVVLHNEKGDDEVWEISNENMSEDAYDGVLAWAAELLASEEWTANVTSIPDYCTQELVFTNVATGMTVSMFYDYSMDIDWDALAYVYTFFVDYIRITLTNEAPVEPVELLFSEILAEFEQVPETVIPDFGWDAFDDLAGTTTSSYYYYEGSFPYGQAEVRLNNNATSEQALAMYDALEALFNEIEADYLANPDNYQAFYNYNDTDTPIDGAEHSYYCRIRIYNEAHDDYQTTITIVASEEYGVYLLVTSYGNYIEPAPESVAGGLQSYFDEYMKGWAEDLGLVEDGSIFDGAAANIPFSFVESGLDAVLDSGFATVELTTEAYSEYQLMTLFEELGEMFEKLGMELYDAQYDQQADTYRYIYNLMGYQGGYAFIQANIYLSYNATSGVYTVRIVWFFINFQ